MTGMLWVYPSNPKLSSRNVSTRLIETQEAFLLCLQLSKPPSIPLPPLLLLPLHLYSLCSSTSACFHFDFPLSHICLLSMISLVSDDLKSKSSTENIKSITPEFSQTFLTHMGWDLGHLKNYFSRSVWYYIRISKFIELQFHFIWKAFLVHVVKSLK